MRQEAIDLQQNAVLSLLELTATRQDEITFKAPTGSGKTYMMADMMNRILEQDKDVVFLVSTLSKGDLATQNHEKFLEYSAKGNFKELKPYLISSEAAGEERLFVPTEYNVYLLPRDLYKKGGRLMQGAMESFLQNMTLTEWLNGLGKKVYLIKDECHIATNNLDNLSERFFTKTYNFSATPKLTRGQNPDVEIKNDDAVNAKLIKDIELTEEDVPVANAISKFEEIKVQYRNLLGVNPCLIIQISNKDKADEELAEIHAELNKAEHTDLKWMLIVNDDKQCDTNDVFKAKKMAVSKWKDYAKENSSTIDIIIFKMVITEGWDIPRACMLYQMRDSKSKQLDEQVMGRVRRNPRLLDFETLSEEAQSLAMTSWIWGIVPEDLKKSFGVKLWQDSDIITDEIKVKTIRLKKLNEKRDFELTDFLERQPAVNAPSSIFKLWSDFKKAENNVQDMGDKFATDYGKWRKFAENIEAISSESSQYVYDYAESMEVVKDESGKEVEVSFAIESHYTDNGHHINITDWIWKRSDGKDKFSFDSDAERQWVEVLKDLTRDDNNNGGRVGKRIVIGKRNPNAGVANMLGEVEADFIGDTKQVYLWGKNYVANSQIKFEYYLGALHSSYPDFVMKDSYNRIHIFEVKSVNISSNMLGGFDNNIYKTKLEELKKAYKQASKLTNQIFYLPIMRDDAWRIFQYIWGNEKILSKDEFVGFCRSE
ncbi:DEAD/DEAH box helicase family protein [Candidatus Saccharibacteria bacterium]|nr:DEAD/DEAH box helicase family protein [Candidatus Saccharibacteria bacterium]